MLLQHCRLHGCKIIYHCAYLMTFINSQPWYYYSFDWNFSLALAIIHIGRNLRREEVRVKLRLVLFECSDTSFITLINIKSFISGSVYLFAVAIVIPKFLKCHSEVECRAPAYS